MKKFIPWVIIGFLIAVIIYLMFFKSDRRELVQDEIKADTLYVEVPAVPDTVYQLRVKIKRDTVFKALSDVVLVDSVYVEEKPGKYVSEKTFEWEYAESFVRGYAVCAIDSFENRLIVNWDDYFIDKVYPIYANEIDKQKKRGRYEGAIMATGIFIAGIFLFK